MSLFSVVLPSGWLTTPNACHPLGTSPHHKETHSSVISITAHHHHHNYSIHVCDKSREGKNAHFEIQQKKNKIPAHNPMSVFVLSMRWALMSGNRAENKYEIMLNVWFFFCFFFSLSWVERRKKKRRRHEHNGTEFLSECIMIVVVVDSSLHRLLSTVKINKSVRVNFDHGWMRSRLWRISILSNVPMISRKETFAFLKFNNSSDWIIYRNEEKKKATHGDPGAYWSVARSLSRLQFTLISCGFWFFFFASSRFLLHILIWDFRFLSCPLFWLNSPVYF